MPIRIRTSLVLAACLLQFAVAAQAGEPKWIQLFKGDDASGLRPYGGEEGLAPGWKIEKGTLHALPTQPRKDLITKETFQDFQLEFEWMVSPGGNSGVMYRVKEKAGSPPWHTGPEYQILDDALHHDGKNPLTSAGALYALKAPNIDKTTAQVGKWNVSRIVMNKGRVQHWLNGAIVVDYVWSSDDIQARIRESKFAKLPGFMGEAEGHIVFQHHGQEVWLKDIRICRLNP